MRDPYCSFKARESFRNVLIGVLKSRFVAEHSQDLHMASKNCDVRRRALPGSPLLPGQKL